MIKPRSAIRGDLFVAESRAPKVDSLGNSLVKISEVVDLAALANEIDCVVPRVFSSKGGRPPVPTETMVRIFVLKRLHIRSGEQAEFQLLDRLSYQRFCGLTMVANIPDRKTVWNVENWIGAGGAAALFVRVLMPNCLSKANSAGAVRSLMRPWSHPVIGHLKADTEWIAVT